MKPNGGLCLSPSIGQRAGFICTSTKDQTEISCVDFLRRVKQAAPMKMIKRLTDNGSQFTDRFTSQKKESTGKHRFDLECVALGIEHRLSPPRHPQTNGRVERFNRRIAEVTQQTRFASAAELETTLERYATLYNHHIPQRALNHLTGLDICPGGTTRVTVPPMNCRGSARAVSGTGYSGIPTPVFHASAWRPHS